MPVPDLIDERGSGGVSQGREGSELALEGSTVVNMTDNQQSAGPSSRWRGYSPFVDVECEEDRNGARRQTEADPVGATRETERLPHRRCVHARGARVRASCVDEC